MTLTTAAKDYIATYFGAGTPKCFVSSGISYTDVKGVAQVGSTQDVVATLKFDPFGTGLPRGPGGEKYLNIPDYTLINDDDIVLIGNSQSGAAQYCVGAAPPPSPICTPNKSHCYYGNVCMCSADGMSRTITEHCDADGCTIRDGVVQCYTTPTGPSEGDLKCLGDDVYRYNSSTAKWEHVPPTCEFGCSGGVCNTEPGAPGGVTETEPFEVYVGGGISCPSGAPSVTLDTAVPGKEAFAYYKAQPVTYVGIMNIFVHNLHSECFAYFAWEMRMWPGKAGTTCPTTKPERQEISRYLAEISDKKIISVKRMNASSIEMIGGSFEIPSHFEGYKTICLSLWGNFSKQALIDELAAPTADRPGYPEEIVWV